MFINELHNLRYQITIHVRKLTAYFSQEIKSDDLEVYSENGNEKGKVYLLKGNLIYSKKELEEKVQELINDNSNIKYNIIVKEKGFVIELFNKKKDKPN